MGTPEHNTESDRSGSVLRNALRFGALATLIYLVLLLAHPAHGAWPGLGRLHAHVLAAMAQTLLGGSDSLHVTVVWPPPADGNEIRLSVPGRWSAHTSSMLAGYGAMAMAASLILASPVPWRRRAAALLLSAVLLHGLMFVRAGLQVRFGLMFATGPQTGSAPPSPSAVEQHLGLLVHDASVAYAAAVVVWLVTTFRPRDLARLTCLQNVAAEPSGR